MLHYAYAFKGSPVQSNSQLTTTLGHWAYGENIYIYISNEYLGVSGIFRPWNDVGKARLRKSDASARPWELGYGQNRAFLKEQNQQLNGNCCNLGYQQPFVGCFLFGRSKWFWEIWFVCLSIFPLKGGRWKSFPKMMLPERM